MAIDRVAARQCQLVRMSRRRLILLLSWLVLALVSAITIASRLHLSFDLSAFLPTRATLEQEILLEQLRSGPGSRLLVVGLSGVSRDKLAELSDDLKHSLAQSTLFLNVANGEFDWLDARIPSPVDRYYLLLKDIDYGTESLKAALDQRLKEMAFGGGAYYLEMVARDPFLVTVDLLKRLAPAEDGNGMWFAADGSAVLLLETRANAVDLGVQAEAIKLVRNTFAILDGADSADIDITGVGAFGVELQGLIRSEAGKRSALAGLGLILVLLLVYRRLSFIVWAGLPLALGFLVGLALLCLIFDTVHGITLAFGFTLMGIAIDYPLHLFSHSTVKGSDAAIDSIWRTMRLGAASTALAYLVLAFSGSGGLAQLGIFTSLGVIVAVLATRYLLPAVMQTPAQAEKASDFPSIPRLTYWPALLGLLTAAAALTLHGFDRMWDDEISSLSPVSEQRLRKDVMLRSSTVSPDMRYQLVVHDESLERLLEKLQQLNIFLEQLQKEGLIESWQLATHLLATNAQQLERRAKIPDSLELARRLSDAVSETPFDATAFNPFLEVAAQTRRLEPLGPADFRMTPLNAWLGAHLLQVNQSWVGLVSLNGLDIDPFRERVFSWNNNLEMVDLQASSRNMMREYRNNAIWTIAAASGLIILLLSIVHRRSGSLYWILLSITAAVGLTFSLLLLVHGQLTVIHLVALLLVLGLGLDYALFLGRDDFGAERRATVQAVMACAASTTLAFGVLAASGIPLLRFLGMTVATGSAVSFLLAYLGSSPWERRLRRNGS